MSELRQRNPRSKDPKHLAFIGHRSGRLEVIEFVGPIANTTLWRVRCDCGTEKVVRRGNLLSTKSCGCLTKERLAARATHGLTRTGQHHPLYSVWESMNKRCHGKTLYPRYGGRGISVCQRWRFGDGKKTGFECFLEDMGEKPSPSHSIDRIDCNGQYEPQNCRWATQLEQQRNKSSNRVIEFDGRQMTLAEAIELTDLKEGTVAARLAKGWPVEKALTTPAGPPRRRA